MRVFLESLLHCLTKPFRFSGKTPRKSFFPFSMFFVFSLSFISLKLDAFLSHDLIQHNILLVTCYSLIIIYLFMCFVTACVRRLHDINISGKWLLLFFVPTLILKGFNYMNFTPSNFIVHALVFSNNAMFLGFMVLLSLKSKSLKTQELTPSNA